VNPYVKRCDIEMIDDHEVDGIHVAADFKINGESIYLPPDAEITIKAGPAIGTLVTVTMYATSVKVEGVKVNA